MECKAVESLLLTKRRSLVTLNERQVVSVILPDGCPLVIEDKGSKRKDKLGPCLFCPQKVWRSSVEKEEAVIIKVGLPTFTSLLCYK